MTIVPTKSAACGAALLVGVLGATGAEAQDYQATFAYFASIAD